MVSQNLGRQSHFPSTMNAPRFYFCARVVGVGLAAGAMELNARNNSYYETDDKVNIYIHFYISQQPVVAGKIKAAIGIEGYFKKNCSQ